MRDAASSVRDRARRGRTRRTKQRFGYICIICATGLGAAEMLTLTEERLANEPEDELRDRRRGAAQDHAAATAQAVSRTRQGGRVMSTISTHVLDTSLGRPAARVQVILERSTPREPWCRSASGRRMRMVGCAISCRRTDARSRRLSPAVRQRRVLRRDAARDLLSDRSMVEFRVDRPRGALSRAAAAQPIRVLDVSGFLSRPAGASAVTSAHRHPAGASAASECRDLLSLHRSQSRRSESRSRHSLRSCGMTGGAPLVRDDRRRSARAG